MRVVTLDSSLLSLARPPLAVNLESGTTINCPFSSAGRAFMARSFYVVYENLTNDVAYAIQSRMANASGTTSIGVRSRQAVNSVPTRADLRIDYMDATPNAVTAYGSTLDGFFSGDIGVHVANARITEGLFQTRATIDKQGTASSVRSEASIANGLPTSNLLLGGLSAHSRPIAAYVWDEYHDDDLGRRINDWLVRRHGKAWTMTWGNPSAAQIGASRHGLVTSNSGASAISNEEFYHPGGPTLAIRTYVRGTPLPEAAPDRGRGRIRYSLIRSSDGAEVYASGQTFDPDTWVYVDLTFGTHDIAPGNYRLKISGANNYQSPVLELASARKTSA